MVRTKKPTDNVPFIASPAVEAFKPSNVKISTTDVVLKPCNYVGNFVYPQNKTEYKPMVDFLLHCPIYTTLSVDLEPMYILYLVEYWYTLRFCDGSDEDGYVGFKGTVNQGNNEVCFQLNRFRLALGLNYGDKGREYEDPICAEDARSIIDQIDYLYVEGDRRVTRAHMNGEWNLFFAHIIQCMGTNTGSHD